MDEQTIENIIFISEFMGNDPDEILSEVREALERDGIYE